MTLQWSLIIIRTHRLIAANAMAIYSQHHRKYTMTFFFSHRTDPECIYFLIDISNTAICARIFLVLSMINDCREKTKKKKNAIEINLIRIYFNSARFTDHALRSAKETNVRKQFNIRLLNATINRKKKKTKFTKKKCHIVMSKNPK